MPSLGSRIQSTIPYLGTNQSQFVAVLAQQLFDVEVLMMTMIKLPILAYLHRSSYVVLCRYHYDTNALLGCMNVALSDIVFIGVSNRWRNTCHVSPFHLQGT